MITGKIKDKSMKFWETSEWQQLKTIVIKTEKVLTRVEYLKAVGFENYSDEKYHEYLKIMAQKEHKENK